VGRAERVPGRFFCKGDVPTDRTTFDHVQRLSDQFMMKLKAICRTISKAVQEIWLPQTITRAFRLRQQKIVLNENEIERLDRIRNPSKYLGK
jgi:hypothetical protein